MTHTSLNLQNLSKSIREWGFDLGFQQIGITDTDLSNYTARFLEWLAKGFHGSMDYMAKHGSKRYQPAELMPGTLRIISARMDYLPPNTKMLETLADKNKAYIARYAMGKDYHRLMRKRLATLAERINAELALTHYRAFCDSAPILEKSIAEKAGLGFMGKHTNLINTKAGSWFFLGEIFVNIPLPIDPPTTTHHCGSCTACMRICPTQAIVGPYQLDARRCISYLTIELKESIPVELRSLMGNRIFGCDDCQLVCPWNKFAKFSAEDAFKPRAQLQSVELLDLFAWSEADFLERTQNSPIRRIGYVNWLRNIAVALGNALPKASIVQALQAMRNHPSVIVQEHVAWALANQLAGLQNSQI